MQNLLAFLIICSSVLFGMDEKNLIELRNLYEKAANSKNSANKLNSLLEDLNANDMLITGYKGAALMIEAKFVFSPFTKLNKFKKGKNLIEYAIKNDPNNTELRYVRLSIQTNIPSFLGYDGDVTNDKIFLIEQLPTLKDADLKARIIKYLTTKNLCNENELLKIGVWKSK